MPLRVVEVQSTPNPNAAKFVLDGPVTDQPVSFFNAESARGHVRARQLFEIPGVSSLLLLGDFVTINKRPEARWDDIRSRARRVLEGDLT